MFEAFSIAINKRNKKDTIRKGSKYPYLYDLYLKDPQEFTGNKAWIKAFGGAAGNTMLSVSSVLVRLLRHNNNNDDNNLPECKLGRKGLIPHTAYSLS